MHSSQDGYLLCPHQDVFIFWNNINPILLPSKYPRKTIGGAMVSRLEI